MDTSGEARRWLGRPVRWLRQPEYTGDNRCAPCTLLNVGIAAALSIAIGTWSTLLGAGVLAVSLGIIGVRGYLVPGTPTITARYFPERVLQAFDKGNDVGGGLADATDFDVEKTLLDSAVVEPCEHEDDLCLTEGFHDSWKARMEALGTDDESLTRELAGSLEVDADDVELARGDTGRVAVELDGDLLGSWPSEAALHADLAADTELGVWCDGWDDMDAMDRSKTIAGLRAFLEECPVCGGRVTPLEEGVASCCRKNVVEVTAECQDCGDVVFEGSYT